MSFGAEDKGYSILRIFRTIRVVKVIRILRYYIIF